MQVLTTELTPKLEEAYKAFLAKYPGKTVFQFRTLGASSGSIDMQQADGTIVQTPTNASYCAAGKERIPTPEGQPINLLYTAGETEEKVVNGQTVMMPRPKAIWFEADRGCVIDASIYDDEKLKRLLFSKSCINNINPVKEEPIDGYKFELIEPERTAKEKAEYTRFVAKVQYQASIATTAEQREILKRMRQPVPVLDDEVSSRLHELAAINPAGVDAASNDAFGKNTAFIEELLAAGVVEFIHEERRYVFGEQRQGLIDTPTGEPKEVLAHYFCDAQSMPVKTALRRLLETKQKAPKKK